MKNISKLVSLTLAATLISTVMFTGCNKNNEEKASSTTNTATTTETKTTLPVMGQNLKYDPNLPVNDNKPITLKFWITEDWSDVYEKWASEYSKIHTNVKFEFNKSGWGDYWKKLPIAIQSGTGPDIFHMHNSYTDVMLANMEPMPNDILPLDQLKKDFRQVDSHIIDGKIHFIDVGIMTSGIFYNKKLWSEAGLKDTDIPKTWDQLRSTAKKLTKTDASGKITVNGFDFNGNAGWFLLGLNAQKGIYAYKQDGKNTNLNNPETIAMAKMLQDMAFVDKVFDPKGAPSNEAFGNEKSAMMYCWAWAGNYLKGNFPNVDFGFFKLPTFDGQEPPAYDRNNGECSFSVSSKASAEAKKVSFDFLKYYLANDEAMVQIATKVGVAPSKFSIDKRQELANSPICKVQGDVIERTIWTGIISSTVDANMGKIVNDGLMLKNESAEKVLKQMDDEIAKTAAEVKIPTSERSYKYSDKFKK